MIIKLKLLNRTKSLAAMHHCHYIVSLSLCLFVHVQLTVSSVGDRLLVYRNYLSTCLKANCSSPDALNRFHLNQPAYLSLLGWDCPSECQLEAQWKTIGKIKATDKNYPIPQFHGKWTFYRFFGIQEPAAFFFSICNFISTLYGWIGYRKVGRMTQDPFYNFWMIQAVITLNGWFWSAVFHARETPFTEKMDYFSAFMVVVYFLYVIVIKLSSERFDLNSATAQLSLAIPFLAFYLHHINYLSNVRFDYGYNMKVNVITGVASSIGWLLWCHAHWHDRPHILKCLSSVIFINMCLALELCDFHPLFYTFDAHSIWHLATSFIPPLWYSFLIDEAQFLLVKNCNDKTKLL